MPAAYWPPEGYWLPGAYWPPPGGLGVPGMPGIHGMPDAPAGPGGMTGCPREFAEPGRAAGRMSEVPQLPQNAELLSFIVRH